MAERQGIGKAQPMGDMLFDFAEAHGIVVENGRIHDAVTREGRVLSKAHRSWPRTERIKALVVRGERTGRWDLGAIACALEAILRDYLAPAPTATWIDHIDSAGAPIVTSIPASTLYHLFLAYAELNRCADRIFRANTHVELS
jgi:mannose/cellobiose epimerase-like protein (N-acyl-D-glucosamine 2-epimerase family)